MPHLKKTFKLSFRPIEHRPFSRKRIRFRIVKECTKQSSLDPVLLQRCISGIRIKLVKVMQLP